MKPVKTAFYEDFSLRTEKTKGSIVKWGFEIIRYGTTYCLEKTYASYGEISDTEY